MATTVDTLVTKYTLDPSGYSQGASKVASTTQGLASKIGVLAGTAGALSLTGMAAFAINSAVSFDTLTRSLTAVTKSGDRAAQVLKFVDKLAIPSIFDSEALAQAATTLEAFGLTTERFLPIAEKLGTVFGGTTQDLMQFVNALGMIRGGRVGEGIEALSRAGIGREALGKRGMAFDKGGSYLGDVKTLLKAIEAEVNDRFGKIGEIMGEGAAAKFASFTDSLKRGMRDIGNAILTFGLPYVTKLADAIQEMTENGTFREWGDRLVSIFKVMSTIIGGVMQVFSAIPAPILGMVAALALVKSSLSSLTPMAAAFGTAMKVAMEQGAMATMALITKVTAATVAIAFAIYIAEGMKRWIQQKTLQSEAEALIPAFKTDEKGRFLKDENGKYIQFSDAEREELIRKAKKKILEKKFYDDTGIEPSGMVDSSPVMSEQVKLLSAIEKNTAPIREMMSYVFGGGELGRAGVGVTSMRGSRSHTSVHRQIAAMTSMGLLRRA